MDGILSQMRFPMDLTVIEGVIVDILKKTLVFLI